MMSLQTSPVWVVIPAAGIGQRMRSELPKQYLKILDKTIIEHTLDCFLNHPEVAGIVVVTSPEDDYWKTLAVKPKSKTIYNVEGGKNRSDSVMQGLKYLSDNQNVSKNAWVMVHDAARPCLSRKDIDSLLSIRTDDCIGGILASPVRDTMKKTFTNDSNEFETVSHTESRDNLWHAMTPQMFRLAELTEAIEFCQKQGTNITDECSAMESKGFNPVIVEGSHNNIKVTYSSDIQLTSFLISNK